MIRYPVGLLVVGLALTCGELFASGVALVRHAPSVNGTLDGTVQQMTGESGSLNGAITGDWEVPGMPTIQTNGRPAYAGTIDGSGATSPTGYTITLTGGASLTHVVRRTDPVALPVVSAPPQPTGTRSVTITASTGSPGDIGTLRNLTLNGGVGQFAIPPGTYGDFAANGGSGFTLGVAGSAQPSLYNFQHLTLNGQATITVVGPVVINVSTGFAVNGSVGSSQYPSWLTLDVYSGALAFDGGSVLYGTVNAPNSSVTIHGGAQVVGGLDSDRLTIEGSGLVRLVSTGNLPPNVSLTAPTANAIFAAPATINLTASANDPDGTVANVQFFANGTKIGEADTAPYTFSWANVAAGSYVLTAVATDNAGATATSVGVSVVVDAPPAVTITSPGANAVFTAPAAIAIQADASDSDGSVTKVEFYAGTTKIGESMAAPFVFSWSGVVAGSYSLTAVATDDRGFQTTSTAVPVVVNAPPTVSLTSPTPGATYTAPATIVIGANPADSDGSITQVDFYNGGTKLGTATTAPYQFTWSNVPAGSYTLTAVATDDLGASTVSAPVSIQVVAPNQPPSVIITAPTDGSILTAPATIAVTASASDPDGSVASVAIFQGSTQIGHFTAPPYTANVNNLPAGTYTFSAIATDNQGASTTSNLVTIVVNAPPTVALTSPATGAVFAAPANVQIAANASDSDGSIAKVEFFSGTTKLGEATTAPYQFNWTNVPAGNYTLTATATDNRGATTPSAPVSITVDIPPTVSLTAPPDQSVFDVPANVTLAATAADADGTVAKVEFFVDGTKVGEALAAPYQFAWTNAPAGEHVLTARATDNAGIATTSAAINVLINIPPVATMNAPANGALFVAPANFTLGADATDSDGTVVKVEFYQGTTSLGQTTTAPYQWPIVNLTAGTYTFSAKATDDQGAVTTSAPITVVVDAPPAVALSAPADGTAFGAPASVTLVANATDSDGTVAKVEFFNGTTKVGEATAAPYQVTLDGLGLGTYTFTAVATDDLGATTTSAPIHVVVEAAPTVALTAPANGAVFNTGSDITLIASANDTDGTVAKVEFYNGTTKLGEATTAPYQFVWTAVSSGAYTLTAVATDNLGVSTTSAPIAVAVDVPPTVSLTAPVNNATFGAGAPIAFSATAADSDGTIAKVEFFAGASKVGDGVADSSGAYTFTLGAGLPTGSYAVTAKATDNLGVATTSAAVTIQVNAPLAPTVAFNPPPGGAVLAAPANVTVSVNATDPNGGTIAKVDFYLGSTLVGTTTTPDSGTTSTFSFTSSNTFGPGSYVFSAVATSSFGLATTTPTTLTITVLPALPYATDFEASEGYVIGSISGQLGWTVNQGAAQVTTSDAAHGTQSVTLAPGASPAQVEQVFAPAVGETIVFADFFAKPVAESAIGASSTFDIESSRFAFVLNGATASLQVFNGDGSGGGQWQSTAFTTPVGSNGQALGWVRLTARIDFTNKTWDLYANGKMVAADVKFRDSTKTYLSSFVVQGDANTPTLVDDLFAGAANPLFTDVNNDGIDDAWETAHGLSLTVNDRYLDPDGDGITNLQEYINGTDPTDYYNGALPVITSLVVNNLPGPQGLVQVKLTRSSDGTPLANAPVTFTVSAGYTEISATPTGTLANSIPVLTDANGIASVYLGGILFAPEAINVDALSGAQQGLLVIPLSEPLTDDVDGNGLPDWWEMKYFGHIGVDPNADPDADGATNYQEYVRGTSPVVADPPSDGAAAALRIYTPLSR